MDGGGVAPEDERSCGEGVFACVGAELTLPCVDFWEDLFARLLWTRSAPTEPMPALRSRKARARAAAEAAAGGKRSTQAGGVLLIGYDEEAEAARVHSLENAQRALALKRAAEAPKRDGYVKGAMEWERNAWKVWDKKKEAEEKRRDRYGRALTHYIGGTKIVVREEPPALTQCAHCDLGGGVHALRRCMGCFAVAYCCKLHQKVRLSAAQPCARPSPPPTAGLTALPTRRCTGSGISTSVSRSVRQTTWKRERGKAPDG